jgi:hypothetical protein
VLARLKPIGTGKYEGRTIKRLAATPGRVLGIFRAPDRLTPTDRRAKAEWRIRRRVARRRNRRNRAGRTAARRRATG